ncbi:hypothetical protein R1sor_005197 [Riccia sorocarpa]|uniref:Reverse transcriptase domain-containing protein n=1 Tax=Riccia sorocarpa TaxID=122646 RepID=A0ABD3HKV4_9MARC
MCNLAVRHFSKLLQEEKEDRERMEDTLELLSRVRRKLNEDEKKDLDAPFSEVELRDAAKEMKRGKSPGSDGAPLDFRKAFHSVNWQFLRKMLEMLNFGHKFQGYINAILSTATSCIIVNGAKSNPVAVTRSVRQGYPLSPLLFILVTEMLTAAVEYEVATGEVEGLYLEKANMHYCLGFLADDSHLIIRAQKEGAFRVENLLDSFARATCLLIQWAKSTARWIGPMERHRPCWTTELAWSWKDQGEVMKMLGFSFTDGISAEEMLHCKRKLWGTVSMAKDAKVRKIDTQAKRRLWEEGYRLLGDIMKEAEPKVAAWEDRIIKEDEQENVRKAYTKVVEGITDFDTEQLRHEEKVECFYEADQGEGVIWAWQVEGREKHKNCNPPENSTMIRKYKETKGLLSHYTGPVHPENDRRYQPICVTAIRGCARVKPIWREIQNLFTAAHESGQALETLMSAHTSVGGITNPTQGCGGVVGITAWSHNLGILARNKRMNFLKRALASKTHRECALVPIYTSNQECMEPIRQKC